MLQARRNLEPYSPVRLGSPPRRGGGARASEAVRRLAPIRTHSNYVRVEEALANNSTRACIRYLLAEIRDGPSLPVTDDRLRSPGEEAIRDALEIHPGADRALVRDYFAFRRGG